MANLISLLPPTIIPPTSVTPLGSSQTLTEAGEYFVSGDFTITLPDPSVVSVGSKLVITPATGAAPIIMSVTDDIKAPDGTLHDTVNFDTHVTLTFIANNAKWEV